MIPRLFLDTNVMLDFLGERFPFYYDVEKIVSLSDQNKVKIVVSPISYTTVSYFLTKYENSEIAIRKLRKFKAISDVCIIDETTIEKGLSSNFKDFEDALQFHNALDSNCSVIITRNLKDFKKSTIPVLSPTQFIKTFK